MTSPFGKAVVVADRRAGSVARDLGRLGAMLDESGLEYEIRPTGRDAGPAVLARRAIEEGATFVIAAGNDATVHMVVNGMMDETGARNPDAVLGIIPVGSDFVRTFGLPQGARDAVTHLAGDNVFEFDVGLISCTARGEPHKRWFVNIAEAGFGGQMVRGVRSMPRSLGRLRNLLSFWGTLGGFSPVRSRIALDGRTYEGSLTNLVVANGQFMQEGRPVAPRAHPGDGKFDVLIAKGTKRQYVEALTLMPKGTHLPSPVIREYMSRMVEVSTDAPLPIGADGVLVGETPARFDLFEAALRLKI